MNLTIQNDSQKITIKARIRQPLKTTCSFWLGTGSIMFVSCRYFCLFGFYTNHATSLSTKV